MEPDVQRLHVWVARIEQLALPMDNAWLHASERCRLDGLKAPARRQHYLAGHWLARNLLVHAYGGSAEAWQLLERRSQPPEVQAPPSSVATPQFPIRLGLAHSGVWVAAAVGPHDVGLDIEQRGRQLGRDTFAPLLLNLDECADSVDDDGLLARWVAKEAWIKRELGSALPARLQQLQLCRDDAGQVQAFCTADFHLALVSERDVAFVGDCKPLHGGAWRVHDCA